MNKNFIGGFFPYGGIFLCGQSFSPRGGYFLRMVGFFLRVVGLFFRIGGGGIFGLAPPPPDNFFVGAPKLSQFLLHR